MMGEEYGIGKWIRRFANGIRGLKVSPTLNKVIRLSMHSMVE